MPSLLLASTCVGLFILLALTAIPWVAALDLRTRQLLRDWKNWAWALGGSAAAGLGAAFYLHVNSGRDSVAGWGRFYMSVVQLQLAADLIVLVFYLMLTFWPKGGAVAQAAFREGLRQPMFWMLAGLAAFLMLISPFLPYFTFGEDLKMVKNLGYEFTMLSSLLFGAVSAAISVYEEIEGRTAITVISKPISRRQFFLGKFGGILMSALAMTMLLGWLFVWIILLKQWYDAPQAQSEQKVEDPRWLVELLQDYVQSGTARDLLRGVGLWTSDSLSLLPGLVQGFCEVAVLIALATALATRLPMVVNLSFCLAIYFVAHLAPVMAEVTQNKYPLLSFVAQVFQTVLPGLDLFDVSSYVTRDVPPPPKAYTIYTFNVVLYALTYTVSSLLFGLILFEDRDLA
jgi:ABC-type transport system involved in multi-copper enzyme maturation permease subunit